MKEMFHDKRKREKLAMLLMGGMLALTAVTVVYQLGGFSVLAGAAGEYGNAKGLLQTIIGILCVLVTVLGAVFSLMGIIHYASANSEGDGPAKSKAIAQIASGIMLIVLSVALKANAETFANLIVG